MMLIMKRKTALFFFSTSFIVGFLQILSPTTVSPALASDSVSGTKTFFNKTLVINATNAKRELAPNIACSGKTKVKTPCKINAMIAKDRFPISPSGRRRRFAIRRQCICPTKRNRLHRLQYSRDRRDIMPRSSYGGGGGSSYGGGGGSSYGGGGGSSYGGGGMGGNDGRDLYPILDKSIMILGYAAFISYVAMFIYNLINGDSGSTSNSNSTLSVRKQRSTFTLNENDFDLWTEKLIDQNIPECLAFTKCITSAFEKQRQLNADLKRRVIRMNDFVYLLRRIERKCPKVFDSCASVIIWRLLGLESKQKILRMKDKFKKRNKKF